MTTLYQKTNCPFVFLRKFILNLIKKHHSTKRCLLIRFKMINLTLQILSFTLIAVPPMPLNLDIASKTNTSLQVQWMKPSPSHGFITGYRLAYWPTDGNGINNVTATIDGPNIGPFPIVRHITGLQPYTKYSIQVIDQFMLQNCYVFNSNQ